MKINLQHCSQFHLFIWFIVVVWLRCLKDFEKKAANELVLLVKMFDYLESTLL